MSQRILVVDDEPAIADAVADRLRSDGFDVAVVHDGPAAVASCTATPPDLMVLDLMLPGMDGVEVCRQVHQHAPVPVLMLTARTDETDMLVGLGVGADDYMTKPCSMRELTARVKAILRRTSGNVDRDRLVVGRVEIRLDERRVTRDGDDISLTATEFDLLAMLATRPGRVFSRADLLAGVWGYRDGATRTVDSHIRGIRRKLGADSIRTVHAVGYALGSP